MRHSGIDLMYDLYEVKERFSCMAWCSISEFGRREASKGQVNIRWMMEFWKTLTVVVSLDVQQDVVPVKKQN
jgi:hypothetical protein